MPTNGPITAVTKGLILASGMALASLVHAQDNPGAGAAGNTSAPAGSAQSLASLTPEQQVLASDFYRAELVILERKVDPQSINEKMSGRLPDPPDLTLSNVLMAMDAQGGSTSTFNLVPQNQLHLQTAASRLANSGRFRVLLAEGWYQAFPPNYEGEPMWVTIGDWLPKAEHTDVQGQITIDRQRYLHVKVELNHWQPKSPTGNLLGLDLNSETPSRPRASQTSIQPMGPAPVDLSYPGETDQGVTTGGEGSPLITGENWPRAELITWIRETRRMRSEEVHFLDSPTLGVLVFFKKIEPEDAAPLIRELGLTGLPER